MPRYELRFGQEAAREWKRLDKSVRLELEAVLSKRLNEPRVVSQRLHGRLSNCYKIKSRHSGFRVVYTIIDDQLVVLVIAIGHRNQLDVYTRADSRLR